MVRGEVFSPPTSFVCLCQSGFNFGSFSLSLSFVIHLILDSKSIFLFTASHLLLIYYRLFQDFYHCWNKSFVFLFPNLWLFMPLSYCSYFFLFLSLFTSLSHSHSFHISHTLALNLFLFSPLYASLFFFSSPSSLYISYIQSSFPVILSFTFIVAFSGFALIYFHANISSFIKQCEFC